MNLYALLIGIDKYHPDSNVPHLKGCENDVNSMLTFLSSQFSKDTFHPKVLLNQDATYDNIVQSFGKEHLLKAGKGDTVLIHYSGHGARGKSASAFAKYYPDGRDENLVCYDSRAPGKLDLADKELAVLIDRIAKTGAEVVVVLDCCHSGSGTRNIGDIQLGKSRQWEDRKESRPLESYLGGYFVDQEKILPTSKHILLAACTNKEKAFELPSHSGNFTYNLLQVLKERKGKISYADLFTECRIVMRRKSDLQNPQFEPSGYFNPFGGFLGLGGHSESVSYKVFFEDNQWQVNSGAITGLPTEAGKEGVFEVFENEKSIGHATTTLVGMEQSAVRLDFEGDKQKVYTANLRSVLAPKTLIGLDLDAAGRKRLEGALEMYTPIYFEGQEEVNNPMYVLKVRDQQVQILRPADEITLRTIDGDDDTKVFEDAFSKLEHFCKWEKSLDLDNPQTEMDRSEVELWLVELDTSQKVLRKTNVPEVLIDIYIQNGVEQKVPFRLEVTNNHSSESRHCALFYLSDSYGFFNDSNKEIPAGTTAVMMDFSNKGKQYSFELNGKPEAVDIFKIIVSKKKISDYMLAQKSIKLGETVNHWRTKSVDEGKIGALTAKGFGYEEEEDSGDPNDWYAFTMKVKSVAQQAKVGPQSIDLASGDIKILGHKHGFTADVGLMNASSQSRSLEPVSILSELAKVQGLEMLHFGQSTRSLNAPNVLVLNDISGEEGLKEEPLQIELNTHLSELETILPATFDGEHIIPVGDSRQENGKTIVSIHSIPDIVDERRRSLFKAVKLCFMKLVLKSKAIQELRWVDYSLPTIERRDEGLITKVRDAENIIVVIHGIIGDTKGIAECMREAYDRKIFDLVLTFDYENLNTEIQITANALKEKLAAAGIDKDSGKKITILAHSMGGLVSRYFIETLNGNQVVKHLVMAGTPNAGSAIAKITEYRGIAMTLLGFLMNTAYGIPAAASLLGILKQSEKVTPTLEQMGAKNAFLQQLNKNDFPNIPYSIVAGHLEQYLSKNQDARKLMDKMLKLVAQAFYSKQTNDIAVSVNSILSIPKQWNPVVKEVACHHLNYFDEGESIEVLYDFFGKKEAIGKPEILM